MAVTLVVEGVDRCGKSTLIKELSLRISCAVNKMRVPHYRSEAEAFYADYLLQLTRTQVTSIWDRGHISELVYAPLYRPETCDELWPRCLAFPKGLQIQVPIVIIYVYPYWRHLLLPDERPGADLHRELEAYLRVLSYNKFPLIQVSSHDAHEKRWEHPANMATYVLDQVRQLGLKI